MLTITAIIAGQIIFAAALIQLSIAISFGRWFSRKTGTLTPESDQAMTAVIMSVRGCDPTFEASLTGILQQQYAHYQVHLVIDHREDPAWGIATQIKSKFDRDDRLRIHVMESPRETCSLKCHSITQAIEHLSKDTEFIAFLDADVAPHSTWLAELTGPLQDKEIGGVTGSQWFEPPTPTGPGSLIRSAWNAGALVFSVFFANPWAGSFAMRRSTLEATNLISIWSNSIVDDGPLKKAIQDQGLRIEFAPSLIMINREHCSVSYANRWVTRMLTWSRLYEDTFFLSVIHSCFSNLVMLANFTILILAILLGNPTALFACTTALILSGGLSTWAYFVSRKVAARSAQLRGDAIGTTTLWRTTKVLLLVPACQLIYGLSSIMSLGCKRVRWRQIEYDLSSAPSFKRLTYQPFIAEPADSSRSI
ncbi:glycosyltransferase family 2 protein [Mariniblastus sp.]|nr:glycosyltransferase family 2 protein [Mariniblastus sp.]